VNIDADTHVFFDASCLIAAAGNPTGGFGFLLSLCARGLFKAAISQPVLFEAQRNIQTKLGDEASTSYYITIRALLPGVFIKTHSANSSVITSTSFPIDQVSK
jgi:hypothetical protein